jgi:hypothetical protein
LVVRKGHHGIILENLAHRQQLSIYKRKQKRPRLVVRDCWFWIDLSAIWKDWRRALVIVHPVRCCVGIGRDSACVLQTDRLIQPHTFYSAMI